MAGVVYYYAHTQFDLNAQPVACTFKYRRLSLLTDEQNKASLCWMNKYLLKMRIMD